MAADTKAESGWPAGWLIAVAAGVIAAILARWIGSAGVAAALLAGVFVFVVFGVLLGLFWKVPGMGGDDHAHGDGHGHGEDHSHDHAPAKAAMPEQVSAPMIASVAPVPVMAPVAAALAMAADPARPKGLAGPRAGKGDDLQVIEGIGPDLEKLCHEMGIFHFDQIAAWGAGEIAWMNGNLTGFRDRVTRDKWVAQARLIGSAGIDEFRRRAKTSDY